MQTPKPSDAAAIRRLSDADLVWLAFGLGTVLAYFAIGLWCLLMVPAFLMGAVACALEADSDV